ncbi:hypothetical protein NM688_g6649 [Phlebia brevispora]|uniref:Uncharacterized protein n=1 Tax=Phlebia brevispora TaxID=194682 RepID=A0ACC1SDT5_9APHY|nr:hypothetical protein NM688_g6649 [Phlebia brevispora]
MRRSKPQTYHRTLSSCVLPSRETRHLHGTVKPELLVVSSFRAQTDPDASHQGSNFSLEAHDGDAFDIDDDSAQRNFLELLPNELWGRIFKSASLLKADLMDSSMVCHVFRDITQPLFHDTLHIDVQYSADDCKGFQAAPYLERLKERLSVKRITSSLERLVVAEMLCGVRRPPNFTSHFVYPVDYPHIVPATAIFDTLAIKIQELVNVRHVDLVHLVIPTTFLGALARIPRLEHLRIEGCTFASSEETNLELSPHPTLRSLHVVYPKPSGLPLLVTEDLRILLLPLLASPCFQELRLSLQAFSEYQFFLSKAVPMPTLQRLAVDACVLDCRNRPWLEDTMVRYPELRTLDVIFSEDASPLYAQRQDLPITLFPKLTQLGVGYGDIPFFAGRPVLHLNVTAMRGIRNKSLHLGLMLSIQTAFPNITRLDLDCQYVTFERSHLFRAFDMLKQLRHVHMACGGLAYARVYIPKEIPNEEAFMFPIDDPDAKAPPIEYFSIDVWPELPRLIGSLIVHHDSRLPDADLLPHLVKRYPDLKYASWTRHHKDPKTHATQAWTHPEFQPESIHVGFTFWEQTSKFTPRWKQA